MSIYFQHYCGYCNQAYNRTQESMTPGFCSRACEASEHARLNQKSFIQRRIEGLVKQRTPHDAQDHSLGLPPASAVPVRESVRKREYLCACCRINQHNGKPLRLQLFHINGNDKDFAPENVQLLCPNCFSQQ